MKKNILLLLLLTLTCTLCACMAVLPAQSPAASQKDAPTAVPEAPTAAPEATPSSEPAVQPSPEPTAVPSLQLPILSQIDENVQPGAAGASLRAIQSAAALLDWGDATGLDPAEIENAAREWLNTLTDAQRSSFQEKLELVNFAVEQLFTDGAPELLEEAGCENTAYPWGGAPSEAVQALLRSADLS